MWESAVLTTAMSSISIAVARHTTASVPRWLNASFMAGSFVRGMSPRTVAAGGRRGQGAHLRLDVRVALPQLGPLQALGIHVDDRLEARAAHRPGRGREQT